MAIQTCPVTVHTSLHSLEATRPRQRCSWVLAPNEAQNTKLTPLTPHIPARPGVCATNKRAVSTGNLNSMATLPWRRQVKGYSTRSTGQSIVITNIADI